MTTEVQGAAASATQPHGPSVLGGAAVGADVLDELLLSTARDAHGAIAGRVFDTLERSGAGAVGLGRLVRTLHDGISQGVYAGLGAATRGTAAGLRELDRRRVAPRLESSPTGRAVLAGVNGLMGDRLAEEGSELAVAMAVRHDGQDVPRTREALARLHPGATGDVVVFVHGLCESERSWWRGAEESGGSYGERLRRDDGWTPVYLRMNTGLPIADNGATLAGLLDDLVAAWPVDVERVALVGHSMGGLVIRAACAVSSPSHEPWTGLVTDVVTLGTPHLGAPLERVVDLTTRVVGRVPEAAPFTRVLEHRSRGVLDLRDGLARDVQNLPHARYRLVGATLARSTEHPVSATAGDLLVRWPSATGRPRRGPEMFPGAETLHVPGAGHADLLNHPDVHDALRRWLS